MLLSVIIPTVLVIRSYVFQLASEHTRLTLLLSGICIVIFYIVKFNSVGRLQKIELVFGIFAFIASLTASILSMSQGVITTSDKVSIIAFGVGCFPMALEMFFALFVVDMKPKPADV